MPAAHMTRLFLATAATIYVAVFVAFLLFEHPGLGIAHFFYLAIALVALSLGPGWGAVAGGLATLLYMTGVLINHADAVERDPHDLDADPGRQLSRGRARCWAGSRRTTARRTRSSRSSPSATS